MIKRTSLIRRKSLTRKSKNSIDSGVLDPDTNNLGEEQPYWWKQLENYTLLPSSSNSTKFGQTTDILNPDSNVDSRQAADQWWKVLSDLDNSTSRKMQEDTKEKDTADNNVSEESEVEPVIRKTKLLLQPGKKKSRGNIFLDISSDSTENLVSSLARNKTMSSPTKQAVNVDRLSKSSTSKIIEPRPNEFRKTHKNKSKNVFDDVIPGNELGTLTKRKSAILASSSQLTNSTATKTSVLTTNEDDISLQPKAQSTLLDGSTTGTIDSTKDSNHSIKERVILKPKSALLARHFKNSRKNVFKDVLKDGENSLELEETKSIDTSNIEIEENVKRPGFTLDSSPEIVKETSKKNAMAPSSSIGASENDNLFKVPKLTPSAVTSEASVSARKRESRNSRKRSASKEEGPQVALSETPTRRQTRSSSRLKKSKAEEAEDIPKPRSGPSSEVLEKSFPEDADRSEVEDMRQRRSALRATSKRQSDKGGNRRSKEELAKKPREEKDELTENENRPKQHGRSNRLRRTTRGTMVGSDVEDNVQELNTRNASNEQKKMVSSIVEEAKQTRVRDSSKSPSKVQRRSPMVTSNIETEEDVFRKRNSKGASGMEKHLLSPVVETSDQNKEAGASKRKSKRLIKSQEHSAKPITSDSESDEDNIFRKQSSKRARSVQKQLLSPVVETSDQNKEAGASKRKSKRLIKSQEHSAKPITSDSESDEDNIFRKRSSKRASSVQKQLLSPVVETSDQNKEAGASKRKSKRLIKSQEHSAKPITSDSESDEDNIFRKRSSKRASSVQKQLLSPVVETSDQNKEAGASKRKSKRLIKSQEHSAKPITSDSESDEDNIFRKRSSKRASSVQKQLLSPVVETSDQNKEAGASKRKSKRLIKSQEHSAKPITSDSESDEDNIFRKRSSKRASSVQKQLLSPVVETSDQNKEAGASKRKSKRLIKSQEHSAKPITSDSESDEDIIVQRRSRKNTSNMQNELVSPIAKEIEQNKKTDASKRKSNRLTKSQEHSVKRVTSDSESDEDIIVHKQNNKNTSSVQNGLISSDKEETEDKDNRGHSSFALSESELDDASALMRRMKSKKLVSTSKQRAAEDVEQTWEIDASKRKDRSTRLSTRRGRSIKSQRYAKVPVTNTLGSDVETVILKGNAVQKEGSESTTVLNVSSNRSASSSQTYRLRVVTSDFESEKEAPTPKRSSRRGSRKNSIASSTNEMTFIGINGTPRRVGDILNNPQKLFTEVIDKFINVEIIPERSSKTINETREKLNLSRTSINESMDAKNVSKQTTDRLNWPTKLFASSSDEDFEEELVKRNKVSSTNMREITSPVVSQEDVQTSSKSNKKRSELLDLSQSRSVEFERSMRRQEESPKQADVSINQENPEIETNEQITEEEEPITSTINKSIKEVETVENVRSENLKTLIKEAEQNKVVVLVKKLKEKDVFNPSLTTSAKRDNKENANRKQEPIPNVSSKLEIKNKALIGKDLDAIQSSPVASATSLSINKKLMIPMTSNKTPRTSLATTSRGNKVLKGQKTITNFLKVDNGLPASVFFSDKDKVEELKKKLERVKEQAMALTQDKKTEEVMRPIKKNTKSKFQNQGLAKQIHKAYLVNGQPYKPPKLVRPKRWVTDRLYKHLWKHMEPKYKLETRVVSEKFVSQLANVTSRILRVKSYSKYKTDMYSLMKEMARLGIIRNRCDFYNFCYDFFPYELRVKLVPMMLPRNVRNIPYSPEKLYEPI